MNSLRWCAALALAAALSSCNTMRPAARTAQSAPPASAEKPTENPAPGNSAPRENSAQPENPPAEPAEANPPQTSSENSAPSSAAAAPPCIPADSISKQKSKPKPKPVHKETRPQPPAPTVAETAPGGVADAQVGLMPVPVMSILGKRVRGLKGEDMGRVVDVLADASGRVRVAIIDFGGFLGVGDRRIAVDWPLLRFDPGKGDPEVSLRVARDQLKAAPEYKDTSRPQTLMEPAAAADEKK